MPTVQNSALVNKQLQKLGFGTLKDPHLFDQMAMVIRDHTHFRRLLMAVEEGQRHVAYEALAAKLRFKAKPLEDYIIESRQLADQNKLPHYDPKTLAVTEVKPQEIHTERHKQAEIEDGVEYGCTCTGILGPSERCEAHGAPFRERERQKQTEEFKKLHDREPRTFREDQEAVKLAKVAEEAIDRDLREAEATQICYLSCHRCTFEQQFRLKKRSALVKVATGYGWTFPTRDKALCRACSKSSTN